MISNFALLLSHEGIQLAHRSPDGWTSLGMVSLLDDDLTAKLAELRAQGQALAAGDFSTKIVLPGDQIKYLTLPDVDDNDREAAIKDALERTTPYLIDELVFDWEASDDGMNIAAVARDTLGEAENFIQGMDLIPSVLCPLQMTRWSRLNPSLVSAAIMPKIRIWLTVSKPKSTRSSLSPRPRPRWLK